MKEETKWNSKTKGNWKEPLWEEISERENKSEEINNII